MSASIASVRRRPGMYVGNCDGTGVMNLVLEVVANALDQHLAGRCTRTAIDVRADGTIEVSDDGPGITLPLDRIATVASQTPTVDGHRPHAHLGGGGLGLFVVNALSEHFMIATVVDGEQTTIRCERGVIVDGPRVQTTTHTNGTVVQFVPDPIIFDMAQVARRTLTEVLDDLAVLNPHWALSWSFASNVMHAQGLGGRVAMTAGCNVADVASYTATYDVLAEQTGGDAATITVAVALAWRVGYHVAASSAVTSLVNWRRTAEHGEHVEGLYDGIMQFAAAAPRPAIARGLVAEVAVILADVHYGAPSKDLLVTPAVRAPVAAATLEALQRWAIVQPELAAALRQRGE